jgi:hypothetical protein
VFVGGLDDLLLIAAGLSAVGVLGALLLRSGLFSAAPAGAAPPRQVTAPPRPVEGAMLNGAVGRDFVPSASAAANGSSVRPADGTLDVGLEARPRDT